MGNKRFLAVVAFKDKVLSFVLCLDLKLCFKTNLLSSVLTECCLFCLSLELIYHKTIITFITYGFFSLFFCQQEQNSSHLKKTRFPSILFLEIFPQDLQQSLSCSMSLVSSTSSPGSRLQSTLQPENCFVQIDQLTIFN